MAGGIVQYEADLIRLQAHAINHDDFLKLQGNYIRGLSRRWHRYCGGHVDVDDIFQEACEATWRAVDCFKPEKGVPLKKWVMKCVRHRLQKRTERAMKLPTVQHGNIERFGRRDFDAADDFHATAEEVTQFRRRLARVVGSVSPRTGALVHGIASGRGIERVRQEVYADYSIDGAVRKSRVAIRHALKVAEQLDD